MAPDAPRTASAFDRRAVWSWALYDFANSPFTTLVVTFIYSVYFTQAIAPNAIQGTAAWSRAVTASALLVALLSPFLGALADRGGYRKLFLLLCTSVCIAGTTVLYGVMPGQVLQALAWFVLANTAFELGMVFYNGLLPQVAPMSHIGRISGYGWAMGYVGGLLALFAALATLVWPETPWFGFSKLDGDHYRATNLLVAAWFAIFSVPIFLWVPERSGRISREPILRATLRELGRTVTEIRRFRQVARLLLARLLYNDALVTVFAFGGIYAAGTFGFEMSEVFVFGIVLNVTAGLGAWCFGYLDDRIGGKITVQVSLVALLAATALAVVAPNRTWFWVAGIVVGLFVGPTQSASRSLMGRFVPPERANEFFGFFAFSGKLTAFVGPLLLGLITEWSGSQRAGISVVAALLLLGLAAVAFVDEKEGIARGRGSD